MDTMQKILNERRKAIKAKLKRRGDKTEKSVKKEKNKATHDED